MLKARHEESLAMPTKMVVRGFSPAYIFEDRNPSYIMGVGTSASVRGSLHCRCSRNICGMDGWMDG